MMIRPWKRSSLPSARTSATTFADRMPINHFLIIYNLRDEELVRFEPFGTEIDRATEAYAKAETDYHNRADNGEYEIVLVGATPGRR